MIRHYSLLHLVEHFGVSRETKSNTRFLCTIKLFLVPFFEPAPQNHPKGAFIIYLEGGYDDFEGRVTLFPYYDLGGGYRKFPTKWHRAQALEWALW